MIGDILQPTHLLFVLVIALLVLGPKRLPEVGRSLGKGLRDFKGALSGDEPEHHEEVPTQTTATAPVTEQPTSTPLVAEPATSTTPAEHPADSAAPVGDQAEQPEHVG